MQITTDIASKGFTKKTQSILGLSSWSLADEFLYIR